MKILVTALRILFGLTFIASAILKFYPLEAFELILIKQVGVSWALAPLLSRLLIVFEFGLGTMIVFGHKLKWSLLVSMGMLLFFTIYLMLVIAKGEGDENCGCFGELIPMDAWASSVKNLVLLALGGFIFTLRKRAHDWRFSWIALIPIILFAAIPFIVNPLPVTNMDSPAKLDFALMETLQDESQLDLTSNKKVVAVLYSNCVHCQQLATFLSSTNEVAASEELRILIFGTEEKYNDFVFDTGIGGFEHSRTSNRDLFVAVQGTFPTVLMVDSGKVAAQWTGKEVNLSLMSSLLEH
jgi:uncharacterized membrane protein YphA (DoxX/SURF4 family)